MKFFCVSLATRNFEQYISFVTLLVTLQDQSYLKRKLCGILKFVYRQEALCSLKILTFRVLLPYRYKINSSVKQSWFDGLLIWFIVKGKLQGFINDCRFWKFMQVWLQQSTGKTLGVSDLMYCLFEGSLCIYFVCEVGRKKAYVMSLNTNACFKIWDDAWPRIIRL